MQTVPGRRDWAEALFLYAVFLAFAAFVGLPADLFHIAVTDEWAAFAIVAFVAVVVPALSEELVFRVTLGGRDGSVRAALALAAFMLWHPVQVLLGLPMAQPVFLEPAFLAIVAVLGLACTLSWRRSGSIWPAAAMHWATVVLWKGFAGG